MPVVTLPLETWRSVVAAPREKGLPSMLEHADRLELQVEQHPLDQATMTLHLTDDPEPALLQLGAGAAGDPAAGRVRRDESNCHQESIEIERVLCATWTWNREGATDA
jgi:hypothetical protein